MFSFIGGVFKYSLIVLTVLVFSHIIEVKGVSISQHVLNGMHTVTGFSPTTQANRITSSFTKSFQMRADQLNSIDPDITTSDQKALNHVIENSQHRKK